MARADKLVELSQELGEEKWSSDVKPKWSPPEGLFTKSAGEIASTLKSASDDLKQAVSRANFYYNRAGDNESESKRKAVINALHKAYGVEEK
jgi:hypothetical protein